MDDGPGRGRPPTGVTVASGTLYVVAGVIAWGSLWAMGWQEDGRVAWLSIATGVALLAAATFLVLAGRAIRRGRPWAWRAAFVLAGLGILGGVAIGASTLAFAVWTLASGEAAGWPVLLMQPLMAGLLVAASVVVLRTFRRPEARRWFGQS